MENARQRFSGLRTTFGPSSDIFGRWSEIFGKSSKTSSLVYLNNQQNITCPLLDTKKLFHTVYRKNLNIIT